MLQHDNPLAVARDARPLYPLRRLQQRRADRVLEAPCVLAGNEAGHGQMLAIRRPVGARDVTEDVTRRAAPERSARERAELDPVEDDAWLAEHCELPFARHAQQPS